MSSTTLACPCGVSAVPAVLEKPFADGSHLTATCRSCGRYLKHVPKTPEWVALVVARRPEERENVNPQRSLFGGEG